MNVTEAAIKPWPTSILDELSDLPFILSAFQGEKPVLISIFMVHTHKVQNTNLKIVRYRKQKNMNM